MSPTRSSLPVILDTAEPGVADALFSAPFGLFGRQKIRAMIGRKLIRAEIDFEPSQLQPASLDLRISKEAYRVRASFLPGRGCSVRESANPALIEAYLEKYPKGEFSTLAEIRLRELTQESGPVG